KDLADLRSLKEAEVLVTARYHTDSRTVEYVIGTREDVAPGIFHRLTGALSGQGLQILSAEINTLAEGLVFDRFSVIDPDFSGEPLPERIQQVTAALVSSLQQPAEATPAFRKTWQASSTVVPFSNTPAQVRIDNSTSEGFTIVDVFATDRMGLLYT